jgi:hypothetical protein
MSASQSIFLVTSADPANVAFGTGFVIHHDPVEQTLFLLTCAHVVRDIGGQDKVIVMGRPAAVVGYGDPDGGGVDLAVLRLDGMTNVPIMPLGVGTDEGDAFVIPGFQALKPNYVLRPIDGHLDRRIELDSRSSGARVAAWDLRIEGDFLLQPGYSGSPVIRVADSCVVAVVSNRLGDGQKGIAIAMEGLYTIWPGAPPDLVPLRPTPSIPDAGIGGAARPADGLCLTRLINPQKSGAGDIVTTVWLRAQGTTQYLVDSIRVKNAIAGIAGPTGVVALPPDAAYRFTYADGTDRIEALNPALSIGPETRAEASFTLSTAPEKPLYMISSLLIWLHYHTADGDTGALLLIEPFPEALFLCRLLGEPVTITVKYDRTNLEQRLSPPAIPQGIDDHAQPGLYYARIAIPWHGAKANAALLDEQRAIWKRVLAQRAALHRALYQQQKANALAAELRLLADAVHTTTFQVQTTSDIDERNAAQQRLWQLKDNLMLVADLCGAVAEETGTKALLDMLADDPWNEAGLYGLCIRHSVHPDNVLAEYVLRALSQRDADVRLFGIINVLTCFPVGRSMDQGHSVFGIPKNSRTSSGRAA